MRDVASPSIAGRGQDSDRVSVNRPRRSAAKRFAAEQNGRKNSGRSTQGNRVGRYRTAPANRLPRPTTHRHAPWPTRPAPAAPAPAPAGPPASAPPRLSAPPARSPPSGSTGPGAPFRAAGQPKGKGPYNRSRTGPSLSFYGFSRWRQPLRFQRGLSSRRPKEPLPEPRWSSRRPYGRSWPPMGVVPPFEGRREWGREPGRSPCRSRLNGRSLPR